VSIAISVLQTLLLLCLLTTSASAHNRPSEQSDAELTALAEQLEVQLNNKRYLLEALSQLVRSHPDVTADAFESTARQLYSGHDDLLAIQLAKNQIISHVYPLTGNEVVLGYDQLADPLRHQQTQRAINQKATTLAGPYQLRQGGSGIILRHPIYLDTAQTQPWGMAIIVIDWQKFLYRTGLSESLASAQLAIRSITEPDNTLVTGDPTLFDDKSSDTFTLRLHNSRWQIALKHSAIEEEHFQTLLITTLSALGFMFTLLAIVLRRRRSWHSPAGLSVALVLLCSAGLLSFSNTQYQNQYLRGQQALDEVHQQIRQRLTDNLNYQQLLVREYLMGRLEPDTFYARGQRYVADHPELLNLNRVNADMVITNVTPMKNNAQILGLSITLDAPLEAALRARETRSPAYTRLFKNIQGRYSFETWLPIYNGNRFEGLIAAVYDVEKLLDVTISPVLLKEYDVQISDRAGLIRAPDRLLRPLTPPGYGATLQLRILAPVTQTYNTLLLAASLILALGLFAGFRKLQRNNQQLEQRYLQLSQARDALFREKEYSQTTLAAISDAVITLDRRGTITHMNPKAEYLTQLSLHQAEGLALTDLLQLHLRNGTRDGLAQMIEQTLHGHQPPQLEAQLLHSSGTLSLHCNTSPITQTGRVEGAVVVLHDVSQLSELASRLEHQATHDSLTGLINRNEFEQRCKNALETGGYHLLYMDLDQFKLVNDTCGHLAGDHLLIELSALLQRKLHRNDTLARLGGDEFGLLLADNASASVAERADRLRSAVREFRFVWQDRIFELGCSIGMVPLKKGELKYDAALARADMACYIAKDSGRNRIHLMTASDEEASQREGEMSWISELQSAMEEHRLELYQQPIYAMGAKPDTGPRFELLLRLRDRNGVTIPPGAFLPAAERYQLISSLDQHVIELALRHFEQNPALGEALSSCSINLSGQSIGDPAFRQAIMERLLASSLTSRKICFEITETAAIANLASAREFIQQLRQMGVRFALDDFGSGMSSFGYLKELPVDYLKIDGSFVRDISKDPRDRAFVEAIHNVGKAMQMCTVAEFIEDDISLQILNEIGIDYGQGYGLARPTPLAELQVESLEDSLIP